MKGSKFIVMYIKAAISVSPYWEYCSIRCLLLKQKTSTYAIVSKTLQSAEYCNLQHWYRKGRRLSKQSDDQQHTPKIIILKTYVKTIRILGILTNYNL